MKTAHQLFAELNAQDESTEVEAKGAGPITRSVLESVCAFSNEPGLGGGYILIGAKRLSHDHLHTYIAEDIGDTDRLQADLATQCANVFSTPVRPRMAVQQVDGANVLVVRVEEASAAHRPLHFKSEGLPRGAYRRIGTTDHRCTDDDMALFYADRDSYDRSILKSTTPADIDAHAVETYRTLRNKVNSAAEELTYNDAELLTALGCMDASAQHHLTVAGLLLFGTSAALRREMPMVRADYIRVPGVEWVPHPDDRFRTVDMRGPLLTLVYRLVDAVYADLPKGFRLEEGQLQAESTGLPVKALREAIVNALMHRSYRAHSPVQVIRYDNRIEIRNPGYSLKPEERLGTPGSETRNPAVAAVMHDTNLAETKGSGIRAMRRLLDAAHLAPPTFESDREQNVFTTRLLLHHFLSEADLQWLKRFDRYPLNDSQKRGLVMLRELGAIDNSSYRQQSGLDTLAASQELRAMRDAGLLEMKGKGSATYYVSGPELKAQPTPQTNAPPYAAPGQSTQPPGENTQPPGENTQPPGENTRPEAVLASHRANLMATLPPDIQEEVNWSNGRVSDHLRFQNLLVHLCAIAPRTKDELATLLNKREDYLRAKYINALLKAGRLNYRYPEVLNHPQQAYVATGL